MSVRYIYNTSGHYVAFITRDNLFSTECEWLGFIKNGNEVYDTRGKFLGYVHNDDRIVKNKSEILKMNVLPPLRPLRPLRPLKPLNRLKMPRLPCPYEDIFESGGAKNLSPQNNLAQPRPKYVSRISGPFTGWKGNSIYNLENGQTWQQARYKYKYIYKYRPKVEIFFSSGRYYISIDGDKDLMEVRQIK